MQVPGHVVSMYVATCGQNGPALGSDEKEIILLVYVIIDVATTKIVGIQQYLVKPLGQFGKDRLGEPTSPNQTNPPQITAAVGTPTSPTTTGTTTTTTTITTSAAITETVQQVNAELPIAIAQVAGKPLNEVIEQFDTYVRSLSIDPESQNFRLVTDGQLPIRQCLHPEACAKDIELPSYYCRFSDLRKEFVRYKSADLSRALVPVKDIKKLPQMPSLPPLPLSIADMIKELDVKTYDDPDDFYVKESRDMVTVIQTLLAGGHKFEANEIVNLNLEPGICSIDDEIDGSCIVRARGLPWQSSDQDIAKFFRGLNVAKGGVALCLSPLGRRNGEALIRFISQEHRDMALKRHKHHIGNRYIEVYRGTGEDFLAVAGGASNEAQAFLSKGAQVIIRMRGLPYDCTAKQVLDFFTTGENPCNVLDGADGVLFVKKPDGRATGDAFVLFSSESDAPKALSRHRESIGQRYIELFRSTTAEVQQVLNRSLDPKTYEPPQPPLIAQLPAVQMPLLPQHVITSGTTKNCIRLRGLPYEARVEHILHFLDDFAKNIMYQGVHMVFNAQGQPSGEAFIQMDSEEAARLCAQQKHNQFMVFGKKYRYIEVFQCSGDDMNMVLNGGLQSPVNPTKPPLLSPGMLPQAQQATPQTITQLQPAVSIAHPHLSSPHSITQYITSHPSTAGGGGGGGIAQTNTVAANAAAAVAAAASGGHFQSAVIPLGPSAAAMAAAAAAAAAQPLTLSIPPPSQTILAQQQAQFIAQHNLLARQQAAAAAAAAHHHHQQQQQHHHHHQNESYFYPTPQSAAAAAAAMGLFHHSAAQSPLAFHNAAAAAVAGNHVGSPPTAATTPYIFMPRQYIPHHIPLGFLQAPTVHSFSIAAPPAVTATSVSHALPNSISAPMKRSYESAFQQDPAAMSVAKRSLTRPAAGGTIMAPPFGGYTPFTPPVTLLPPPHRAHPAAAFYPPFVYWPYPSPPVSPTTYFGHAPPPPPHVAPSIPPQHQAAALFPVDFVTPTYQQSPASPSQPPPTVPPTAAAGALVATTSTTTTHHQHQHQQYPPPHQQQPPHPAPQFHHPSLVGPPTPTLAAVSPHSVTSSVPPQLPQQPATAACPPAPLNGTYPGAHHHHLLTIDTNTSPLSQLTLAAHDKLGAPRILTPAATTTFALAAAAAAVGPPTLALQGSPVPATGPPIAANQFVELYIA